MKLVVDEGYGKTLYVVQFGGMERRDDVLEDDTYIMWNLYPVAIWDYVDKDWSDKQGWLQELHKGAVLGDMETVIQHPLNETFEELLAEDGYKIVDVKSVYAIEYFSDDPKSERISIEDAVENAL